MVEFHKVLNGLKLEIGLQSHAAPTYDARLRRIFLIFSQHLLPSCNMPFRLQGKS
jgi:hypothetical protein